MDIGMTLPTMVRGVDGRALLEWCRRIDAGPFSTLAAGERMSYPNADLVVALAAAAGATRRVRLMTSLVVLPLHNAVRLAKQAASIDVLSDGRLVLGVGVGTRDEDYAAVGAKRSAPHRTLDEQVAVLRRVWSGDAVSEDVGPVGPAPMRLGGPPLVAGAIGPAALRRAAPWADGMMGYWFDPSPDKAGRAFHLAEEAWGTAGRSRPRKHVTFWYAIGPDGSRKLRDYAAPYLAVFGSSAAAAMMRKLTVDSADQLKRTLAHLQALGCDEVLLIPTTSDPGEVDRVAELLEDSF